MSELSLENGVKISAKLCDAIYYWTTDVTWPSSYYTNEVKEFSANAKWLSKSWEMFVEVVDDYTITPIYNEERNRVCTYHINHQ